MLIAANILMYLVTIAISYIWNKIYNYKSLKLTKDDVKTSLVVLLINIGVAIPGYFLWINSKINFTEYNFIFDLMILFFGFDLAMYVLHYISHKIWPFKLLHIKHHTHHSFNIISLYVMHPLESLLFGILLTISVLFFQFNIYSFLVFITINWLLGVIGHLNTPSEKQPLFFGNHIFHKIHHEKLNYNYGFYTIVWDSIFRTKYQP